MHFRSHIELRHQQQLRAGGPRASGGWGLGRHGAAQGASPESPSASQTPAAQHGERSSDAATTHLPGDYHEAARLPVLPTCHLDIQGVDACSAGMLPCIHMVALAAVPLSRPASGLKAASRHGLWDGVRCPACPPTGNLGSPDLHSCGSSALKIPIPQQLLCA